MTYALAHKALEQFMEASWTATGVQYDNTKFAPKPATPWVRMTVLDGEAFQASLGSVAGRTFRASGIVVFQIFTPLDAGARQAYDLADTLSAIWRAATVSGVVFRVPSVNRVGDAGNGWFQLNVQVPFYRDEIF